MTGVLMRLGSTVDLVHGVGWKPTSYGSRLLPNGGREDRPDVFHVEFDPATEDVTRVLVRGVSVIHNVEPDDLDPLGETVDPEAIQRFLAATSRRGSGHASVEFTYHDLAITVTSDGHVWLEWA